LPRLFAGLVVSLALSLPAPALETFTDEAKAQQHCPKDVVIMAGVLRLGPLPDEEATPAEGSRSTRTTTVFLKSRVSVRLAAFWLIGMILRC